MQTETIIAARLYLARERPYLSMALWALLPVRVEGIGTFAVDKYWRMYYDPALDWDVKMTAAVLYHEIQHLLRIHPERGEGMDAVLNTGMNVSNLAWDCEINDDIVDENNWTLPEGVALPSNWKMPDHLTGEEYYAMLMKNLPKMNMPGQGQGDGKGSGKDKDGKGGGSGDKPMPSMGDCGSAAGGPKRPWEDDSESGGRKIGNAEGKLIGRQVAEDIKKHVKNRGDVPGHWERWADALMNPQVDWRKELAAQIINAVSQIVGMVDYTYRRPGRRSSAFQDIIVPAMTQPIVKVAVIVDTSGSMGEDDLEKCITEVKGILTALGIKDGVQVISCDAAIHTSQKVFNARQVKLAGGGGTDMRVGFQAAYDLKVKPDIIVCLSDGYTPWPDVKPKQKVIIGIIGQDGESNTPAWAKTVYVR